MLVENVKSNTRNTLPTVKSEQMTVDEGATVYLMKAISENLYSSPATAVVREYLSNMLDSHDRAGQTRPALITLPSLLNPTIVFQDFGTGMDEEDISRVYSKVFASDKRDSNKERGGYGLGSKSALALTASFSVVARKNGEERVIIVARDDDNIPVFHTVAVSETDEPNGVTISIPVSNDDVQTISRSIDDLLSTAPHESVLVNGQWPSQSIYNPEQYVEIGEVGWLKLAPSESPFGEILGVRYDLDYNLHGGVLADSLGQRAVLRLPNGDIKLETSRESIRSVKDTRDIITALATQWREEALSYLQARVSEMTRREAYLLVKELGDYGLVFGDDTVPSKLPYYRPDVVEARVAALTAQTALDVAIEGPLVKPLGLYRATIYSGTRPTMNIVEMKSETHTPTADTLSGILLIEDHPEAKRIALRDLKDWFAAQHRKEDQDVPVPTSFFLLTEEDTSALSPWFLAFAQILDLDEVEEVAKDERRYRRQQAAALRAARPKDENPKVREARAITFTSVLGKATSSSDRARLETVSIEADSIEGKVAYIIPSKEEGEGMASDLARICERSSRHPGRDILARSVLYTRMLHDLGYTVVQLRATQKPDIFDDLEDVEATNVEELVGEVLTHVKGFFTANAEICSAVFRYQDSGIARLLQACGLRDKPSGNLDEYAQDIIKFFTSKSRWQESDQNLMDSARTMVSALGISDEDLVEFEASFMSVLRNRLSRRYPLLTGTHYQDGTTEEHVKLYVAAVDSIRQ